MTVPYLPESLFGSLPAVATTPTTPALSLFASDAAPALNVPKPPVMTPKPSILDRLSLNIRKMFQGDAPAGYNQLLTPEQIDAARPTFLQTIFGHGANPDEFQKNLQAAVQNTQILPSQIAATRLQLMQQARQMQVQQDIAKKFAPMPSETPDQTRTRLLDMFAYAAQNGADPKFLQQIGDVVKEVAKPIPAKPPVWKTVGGQTWVTDPETGAVLQKFDNPPSEFEKKKFDQTFQANQDQHAIANEMRLNDQARTAASNFAATNKNLTDTVPKYVSFVNSIEQAKAGNPAALQTSLYGFVNNTDMNAQMRQGILNKLENIAPGIANKTQFEFNKAIAGKLSPKVIADMEAIVMPMHDRVLKLYRQRWDALVKANPYVANVRADLSPENMFTVPTDVTALPATGNKVQQYLRP